MSETQTAETRRVVGSRPMPPRSALPERLSLVFHVVATFVVVVLAWQLVVTVFDISPIIVPGPIDVAKALVHSGSLLPEQLGWTLYATAIGFIAAVLAGLLCALLVTEVKLLHKTLYPLIVGFQSMPHIGMAPLLIIWFGFGTVSHAALAAIVAFFPIFSNMAHGLDTVRGELLRLFQSYQATKLQAIWKLKLPMALPFLFAGANVGIIFAMLAVIVGEFLAANQGMGFVLVQQGNALDTAGVFAVLLVLAVVGIVLHALITLLKRVTLRWT